MKVTDTGNAVQVSIEGEEYALLKRAADTMNTVEWCEADNTPETVCENFVSCWMEMFFEKHGKMAENILDGIDTHAEESTPLHKERIAELEAAFKKAGLMG